MFRVFSAVFLCFSRAFIGVERGKKSLVFRVVFLGFYLNTKEWKIRVRGFQNFATDPEFSFRGSIFSGLGCEFAIAEKSILA